MSFWGFLIIIVLVGYAVDKSIRERIKTFEKNITSELNFLDKKLDDIMNTIVVLGR